MLRRKGLLCRKTSVNYAIRKRVAFTITPEQKLSYNDIALHIHESVRVYNANRD